MRQFKDNAGRTWTVDINVATLKRVRATEEGLRIDSRAKEVYIQGKLLAPPLTVKEFQLLELLHSHKGQVISKDEIAQNVWDYEVYDYNAIDALVYRLRQRIEAEDYAQGDGGLSRLDILTEYTARIVGDCGQTGRLVQTWTSVTLPMTPAWMASTPRWRSARSTRRRGCAACRATCWPRCRR